VVTDGRSNVRADRTQLEAASARHWGVELYVVGVGQDVNLAELHGIASTPTGDHVIMMRSTFDMAAAASTLLYRICRR